MKLNIVDFAHQIIEMQDRIIDLEIENDRLREYKEDYDELLKSSSYHNAKMVGNLLDLCLTPGVIEACERNQTFGFKK